MFLNLKHTCLEVSSNPKDPDYLLQVFLIRLEWMMCAFNETVLYKTKKTCKLIKNTYHTDTSYLLVFDDLLIVFQRLYFKSNICSGFVKAFLSHVLVRVFLACTALTSRHHQWLCSELRNSRASSSNYRCSPETCKWEELTPRTTSGRSLRQEQQVGGAYD